MAESQREADVCPWVGVAGRRAGGCSGDQGLGSLGDRAAS